MSQRIPFHLPDIGEEEIAEVVDTLRSGWITTGPKAHAFEAAFGEAVDAKQAVAVNSCTAAMHLALEAIGVGEGDEVIVPTLTFAATAEVVRYLGAKPVLVDVLAGDQQIDPEAVAAAVTARTKAIIPVHFAGQAADLDPILATAREHGLKVIEDAAHAYPAAYKGRKIGSIGDVTCFSFYATKTLTTGEGGMATCADEALADRMRVMRLHGISKDAWKRYRADGNWYYEIVAPGFKYNLGDIAAALGLVQLKRADELLERRQQIAAAYHTAFEAEPALELLATHEDRPHPWHLYVIRLMDGALSIGRDQFIKELEARGIGVSVHFIPLHLHPYYRETYGLAPEDLPVALDCYRRSLSLPIYSRMSDEDVERVIEGVRDVIAKHPA
ncbi:MAG: DegT/DnrJ/EryC1/StrS family aminotransferase [Deltaproteobacteria bacterium]|nr:DegT/DnrJ/EryC1/StrS family aminotransferase [Deltaproteobacteria bacterium]